MRTSFAGSSRINCGSESSNTLMTGLPRGICALRATFATPSPRRVAINLKDSTSSSTRNNGLDFKTARASLGETKDGSRDGEQRRYFSSEVAEKMRKLCGRATIANLRWLKSLDRPDPE
jgi:hypothetical protein